MEITAALTPVYTGSQRMLLTLNVSLAARLAGGTGRIELGKAAHFQGAKNVLVPLFVNVSNRQTLGGWEGGAVLCVMPAAAAGEERHTRASSQRASKHRASRVLPQPEPGTQGPPLHSIPREGPWASFGEQWQGSKQRQQHCKTNLISPEGCRALLPLFYCQKCLERSSK